MGTRLRARIHRVLRVGADREPVSRVVNSAIMGLILLNVLAFILETEPYLAERYARPFALLELVSVILFTAEYLARIYSAPEDPHFGHPVKGRLAWMGTPLAIVDLLAILPFYLPLVVGLDLRVLRVLRLFRIFRVLKLARYSDAMRSMARVLRNKREELLLTLFTVGVLLVLAASLMFFAEHDAQPEAFESIPDTLWWAVITLTTVGYGDVVPVTPLGRVLGAFIAILGIGMLALPAGILGGGFVEELQRRRAKPEAAVCPHCGEALE